MPESHITATREGRWRRRPGLLLLGVVALALVASAVIAVRPKPERALSLTAGHLSTTRGLFVEVLAEETGSRVVTTPGHLEGLDAVESGRVDVALVPGAVRFERWPHLREVAPLFVEPLHLLVKQELFEASAGDLRALRGRRIALGPQSTLCHWLAADLMGFVGLGEQWQEVALPGAGADDLDERIRALRAAPPDALPDAWFNLGMLPAPVARVVFDELGYRLLALPFAEAYAQSRFMELGAHPETATDHPLAPNREFVYDAEIPAFAYGVEPPIPAERVHTLGTRLLLVAHVDADVAAVEQLIDRVFRTRIARVVHPPLGPDLLALPHELRLHPGALEYRRRREPLITGDSADLVNNVVSVGGALIGGTLFVVQWLRARRRDRRQATFDAYIRRIAAIERRASEIELSSELLLPPLLDLQRELTRLRAEALERFLSGDLDDRPLLSELLEYASSCRDVLGRLILRARDEQEERAHAAEP